MPQTCHRPTVEDAARFLARLCDGKPSREWLTSLLYLADRHHILTHGHSLADDRFATIEGKPHGIGTNRAVSLLVAAPTGIANNEAEFDHLSVADEETLRGTHSRYGHLAPEELDAILGALPEAVEVGPISFRQLAIHLGDSNPDGFADSMETSRGLRWCFEDARCRLHPPKAA